MGIPERVVTKLVQGSTAIQWRVEADVLPNHFEFQRFLFDPPRDWLGSPMPPALRDQLSASDHALVCVEVEIREVKIKIVGRDAHVDGTE
jgi:hypothetical protein